MLSATNWERRLALVAMTVALRATVLWVVI